MLNIADITEDMIDDATFIKYKTSVWYKFKSTNVIEFRGAWIVRFTAERCIRRDLLDCGVDEKYIGEIFRQPESLDDFWQTNILDYDSYLMLKMVLT